MLLESSSSSMVGVVLSARYRLLRLLGQGAMGAVFEAQDLQGQRRYAIKVLHPEFAAEELIRERFYAESAGTLRLVHPNIARCFGYAETEDGAPYIVMELLDGATLGSYLRPGLAYEARHAVPIVSSILAALAAAHGQGVVHRDLKPENVFLVKNPAGPPIVKILDFGIAKFLEAAGELTSKMRAGTLLGTPGYMSPEQIRDAKGVDARSDLWSVGIILYELLTGREAFAGSNETAKLTLILNADPLPIDHGKSQLAPWRRFFVRALAKEPSNRFASALEMDRALVATADEAARSAASFAPGPASTTDMSPELPRGIPRATARPEVSVVATPVPVPLAARAPSDSTLKAGEMPMLDPYSGPRVRLWAAFVMALFCLAAGFAAGFVAAQK